MGHMHLTPLELGEKPPRPNKIERIALTVMLEAAFSTCQRGQVGAAIFDETGQILVLARNGTPRGQPHCPELTTPDVRCQFCIHAEKNAINRAARIGLKTEGKTIFSLMRPCIGCANDIVEAGFKKVYYIHDYDTDGQRDYVLEMFVRQRISFKHILETEVLYTFSDLVKNWRRTWTA